MLTGLVLADLANGKYRAIAISQNYMTEYKIIYFLCITSFVVMSTYRTRPINIYT